MTVPTLQLDPRYPLVWRTPTSLQIGVDHARVRLNDVSRADEAMLQALRVGVAAEGLWMIGEDAGASAHDVVRFVERVRPALLSRRPSGLAHADIVVEGESACAVGLRRLLAQLCAAAATAGTKAAAAAGPTAHAAVPAAAATRGQDDEPDLVVIVAAWAVHPTVSGSWLRRDVPHLPVVFSDQEVRIGPLVTPGRGPCLHCVARAAIDRDDAWPAIAGQLLGRPAPSDDALLVTSVTSIVARLVRSHLDGDGRGLRPGVVVHVNAETGALSETVRAVHPLCACRALPRTAKPPEPVSDSPPPRRTTVRAVGAPG